MEREFKVGLFVIFALFLMTGLLMYSGKVEFGKKYYILRVEFPYIEGLKTGAEVRELGVTVGKVTDIHIHSASAVRVTLSLKKGYPLRKGTRVFISVQGVLGSKVVDIEPSPSGEFLPSGAVISGEPPVRLRDMIAKLNQSIEDFGGTLASFRSFWVAEGGKDKLLRLLSNLQEGSERISEVVDKINGIGDELSDKLNSLSNDVSSLVSELKGMVGSNKRDVRRVVIKLNRILTDFQVFAAQLKKRPDIVKNLDTTIVSIRQASDSVKQFINSLSGSGGEQGGSGIVSSVHKIEKMTREAESVIKSVRSWRYQGGIRLRYGSTEGETLSDLWFRLSREGSPNSVFIGIGDVGGGNHFTGIIEKRLNRRSGVIFGIVRSNLGVGYRYYSDSSAHISADLLIAHNWEVDLSGYYPTSQHYGLYLRMEDVFNERRFYIGAEYRF